MKVCYDCDNEKVVVEGISLTIGNEDFEDDYEVAFCRPCFTKRYGVEKK